MKKRVWLNLSLAILLVIVAVYSYQAIKYQQKFLKNTTIGQINVGDLTKQEADKKLEKELHQDNFEIKDKETTWKSIPKKALGIEYDTTSTVDHAMAKQNPWLWFMSYVSKPSDVPVELTSYNEKDVAKQTDIIKKELTELNKKRTQTKSAYIEHVDGEFKIHDEVQGDNINIDAFIKSLDKDIKAGIMTIQLNDYLQKPEVVASNPELNQELEAINKISKINASYTINGEEVVIPQETIASWVTTEDGNAALKQDLVRAYVEDLGATYNTSTNETSFKSTKRGEVNVPAGAYSWTIATDSETEQLTELILAGEDFSGRVPAFQGSASPANQLLSDTYIEVDLEAQHMWYYKDGKVALETPVITGKPSTPTPPGVFYVWNKARNEILRGEDYASPVDYWMPVDWTGVGIHDSPWQSASAYGGDSFKTVGSHGCINTPPDVCGKLFDMIDTGVPVVIF